MSFDDGLRPSSRRHRSAGSGRVHGDVETLAGSSSDEIGREQIVCGLVYLERVPYRSRPVLTAPMLVDPALGRATGLSAARATTSLANKPPLGHKALQFSESRSRYWCRPAPEREVAVTPFPKMPLATTEIGVQNPAATALNLHERLLADARRPTVLLAVGVLITDLRPTVH